MLLALSNVTYVLIGWFNFLLLKFLYEYWPCSFQPPGAVFIKHYKIKNKNYEITLNFPSFVV